MGLIRAFTGAVGGAFADQWKDFLTAPSFVPPSAALFPAVRSTANAVRSSNEKFSDSIVSNGSKIVVPEGYGLLLLQDGAISAFVAEAGGYVWDSEDVNSASIFAGDTFVKSLVLQSWDRFKFGGSPAAQQLALFVRTQELPNNKFGTQSTIYWDDSFLGTQAGATCRGTFSLIVTDPILFAKQFVPAAYLQGDQIFDFTDSNNPAADQLLAEVVGSLAPAFSAYMNDEGKGNRITAIQQDSLGFAAALSGVVENAYQWKATRGLEISQVALVSIQYDPNTAELLKTVQRADALTGNRGRANLQASVAEGLQTAGSVSGAEGILGIGIAGGAIGFGALLTGNESTSASPKPANNDDEMVSKLEALKRAFDSGLISKKEFDSAKAKALGLS